MMKNISGSMQLTPDELKRFHPTLDKLLERLIDHLCKKSQLKLDPIQRQEIKGNLIKLLTNQNNSPKRGLIAEPDFIKRLTTTIMVALSLKKPENTNDLANAIESLLTKLKDKNVDLKALLKMKPADLNKLLEKEFPNEMNAILLGIKKLTDQLFKDLQKTFGIKQPSAEQQRSTEKDIYSNLFGLLNSQIAGSIAVPVFQYIGNGLGFNDWNPNNGLAPIDDINNINDNKAGDPLGLNAMKIENFLQCGDDPVITKYADELYNQKLNPGMQSPQNIPTQNTSAQ